MISVLVIPAEKFGSRESFLEEVYTRDGGSNFRTFFLMRSSAKEVIKESFWNKARVYLLPDIGNSPFKKLMNNYFFDYRYFWKIIKIVKDEKIDIIQVRDLTFPLFVALCLKLFKGTRVVYQKTFPHELYKIPNAKNYRFSLLAYISLVTENVLLHRMLKVCDVILPITPTMADVLRKKYRILNVPLIPFGMGINVRNLPDSTQTKKGDKQISFIYVGILDPKRNLGNVIKAFSIVREQVKGKALKLSFVGGRENRIAELKKIVSEYDLEKIVKFYGFIDRIAVYALIQNHNIGISYYPNNEMFVSVSPTKLFEYLGLGMPVVATNTVVEQKKIINETGAGVLTGEDVGDLARKMKQIIENFDQYKKVAGKATDYIFTHYNYDHMREKISKIYRDLLNENIAEGKG